MSDLKPFNIAKVEDSLFWVSNPNDILQSWWTLGKYYEEGLLKFIKQHYKGGTFIDAGASVGNHSIFFSKLADKVISFEPSSDVFFQLTFNKFINNANNIVTYNLCLGEENKIVDLYTDKFCCGGATLDKNKDPAITKGIEKSYMVKLDDFGIEDVKLIKIDVEMYELNVLKGAEETIKKYKPDLFIECATKEYYEKIYNFLISLNVGYNIPKYVFNATPTFLFSVEEREELK